MPLSSLLSLRKPLILSSIDWTSHQEEPDKSLVWWAWKTTSLQSCSVTAHITNILFWLGPLTQSRGLFPSLWAILSTPFPLASEWSAPPQPTYLSLHSHCHATGPPWRHFSLKFFLQLDQCSAEPLSAWLLLKAKPLHRGKFCLTRCMLATVIDSQHHYSSARSSLSGQVPYKPFLHWPAVRRWPGLLLLVQDHTLERTMETEKGQMLCSRQIQGGYASRVCRKLKNRSLAIRVQK